MEEYEEVETEDMEIGDYVFIGAGLITGCFIIAFIFKQIKKTFHNVHLKIGDKIELGVETKDDKSE